MTMASGTRTRIIVIVAFFVCLPFGFFLGISLIGHARPLPYVSVWIDRLMLAAVALGLPALAAVGLCRFLTRRRGGNDAGRS
jgi:hypothetical protein